MEETDTVTLQEARKHQSGRASHNHLCKQSATIYPLTKESYLLRPLQNTSQSKGQIQGLA